MVVAVNISAAIVADNSLMHLVVDHEAAEKEAFSTLAVNMAKDMASPMVQNQVLIAALSSKITIGATVERAVHKE